MICFLDEKSARFGGPVSGNVGLVLTCPEEESMRALQVARIQPEARPSQVMWDFLQELAKGVGISLAGWFEGNPFPSPCAGYLGNTPFLELTPADRVARELGRRRKVVGDARLAAALGEGSADDQTAYYRAVKRRDMLILATLAWEDRKPLSNNLDLLKSRSPQPAAMNTVTPEPMHKLSHAQQSAILNKCPFNPDGTVRVKFTHHTEAILHLAGVTAPRLLESYPVPVKRDGKGFLVVDTEVTGKKPPVPEGDYCLFEPGGLFAGTKVLPFPDSPRGENPAASVRTEKSPELDALCELARTRTFEIPTGPQSKVRVQVIAFEDESIPSPNEREQWKPVKPSDVQVHAAVSALHMSRELRHLEQV